MTAPQGGVRLVISLSADLSEMRDWKEDRLAAFFGGIAQVLAAKGTIEQEAKP